MASIDKLTVRIEVSRLKADFEQLCTDGEIKNELKVLMNSMFMIIALMLSIFLEKSTKKNNTNSSIPSSQTNKDESALLLQSGSNSKGKLENRSIVANTRVTESVVLSEVHACGVCGDDLTTIVSQQVERRTR